MSFMKAISLDEAIAHCLEVAEQNEDKADKYDRADEWENVEAENCLQCATDHKQLAEWLKELQELRVRVKKLEDENASLSSHACDLQLAYNNELVNGREAKRLLKDVIADFDEIYEHSARGYCVYNTQYISCDICPFKEYDNEGRCGVWKHKAEALKLIGEE